MLRLCPTDGFREILAIGAHSDDIEIGCGGTIRHLVRTNPRAVVRWVVLSGEAERAEEARASAKAWLADAAESEVVVESFPDRYFPWHGEELKDRFGQLARLGHPDLVLTHSRGDRHQDHRTVAELTWNAFRDHVILEYEIPKWDGDLGRPNVYVPLTQEDVDHKVTGLLDGFPSQRARDWFDPETFRALLRIRGVECRAPSGYAEAFHAAKLVLG